MTDGHAPAWRNLRLGIFFIFSTAALLAFLLVVGTNQRIFTRSYELTIRLNNAQGLSEGAVVEMLTDQLVDTPQRPTVGYGIGCWGERIDPETDRFLLASSGGAFGFIPWIDVERDLIGVFAAYSDIQLVEPFYDEARRWIEAAYPAR